MKYGGHVNRRYDDGSRRGLIYRCLGKNPRDIREKPFSDGQRMRVGGRRSGEVGLRGGRKSSKPAQRLRMERYMAAQGWSVGMGQTTTMIARRFAT
jgi:hypothetical protein